MAQITAHQEFKSMQCDLCPFIYDEAAGLPAYGIAPGTRWEDIPADWHCPVCNTGKAEFNELKF